MTAYDELVPQQVTGSATGATSKLHAVSVRAALKTFAKARARLLDVNNWYNYCGKKGAEFQLTDHNGNPLSTSQPEIGNLIRIRLPAPSNDKGDGYDWVRIEQFESSSSSDNDEQVFGFRVRPVSNPKDRTNESAHFYTSEATSSFLVRRKGAIVFAMERGRNEKPNPTGAFLNKLRNFFVAVAAMLGMAVPQWKMLTRAILKPVKG